MVVCLPSPNDRFILYIYWVYHGLPNFPRPLEKSTNTVQQRRQDGRRTPPFSLSWRVPLAWPSTCPTTQRWRQFPSLLGFIFFWNQWTKWENVVSNHPWGQIQQPISEFNIWFVPSPILLLVKVLNDSISLAYPCGAPAHLIYLTSR